MLKLYLGCMFSGKTTILLAEIRKYSLAGMRVGVFKPSLDNRYQGVYHLGSHNGDFHPALPVQNASDLIAHLPNYDAIIIDEIQFFDDSIMSVYYQAFSRNIEMVFGGLSSDFKAEPFGFVPQLSAVADEVVYLKAVCSKCHQPATRTQRLVNGMPASRTDPIILVGSTESYEARCSSCHIVR